MVWGDGNHILFTSSRDGGRTFETARDIIETAPIMFDVQGVSRSNGFPVIAMDPKSGRLYVAWSDYRNGDIDVFCSASNDQGRTWTPPARVNSDAVHDGADQFFHWLAVDPATGAVNAIFYDRRGDPENRKTTVVLARSTDGGRSFANYAWTETPFDPKGVFLGDYTGIAAWGGRVYGVWTEKPPSSSRGTIVRVGMADFSGSGGEAAPPPSAAQRRAFVSDAAVSQKAPCGCASLKKLGLAIAALPPRCAEELCPSGGSPNPYLQKLRAAGRKGRAFASSLDIWRGRL